MMKKHSENNAIKIGLFWNTITNFSKYGITFLGTIVLARILTPDDYGLIGIISVFIAISEVLISGGLGGAIIKKSNVRDVDYSTLSTYNIVVAVFFYLLLYILAPYIANFYSEPTIKNLIRICSIVILIHAISIAPQVILTKELKFKALSTINLIGGCGSIGCAVFMALNGFGVFSIAGQYITQAIIVSCLLFVVSKYKIKIAFSKVSFKEQFEFGMNTTLSTLLKSLSENITNNVIAKCFSITQAGYFTQSNRLVNVPQNFFFNLIDSTFFPILSQIDDNNHFRMKINSINKKANLILMLLFGLSITCCSELVYILLGEKWINMEKTLKILLYSTMFICLSNVGRNVLKCLGFTRDILKIEVIMFLHILISMFVGYIFDSYNLFLYGYLLCCVTKVIYTDYYTGKYINIRLRNQILSKIMYITPIIAQILIIERVAISNSIIVNFIVKLLLYTIISIFYILIIMKKQIINFKEFYNGRKENVK